MLPSSFMISQIAARAAKTGQSRQVERRLGVAGPPQHAAFTR